MDDLQEMSIIINKVIEKLDEVRDEMGYEHVGEVAKAALIISSLLIKELVDVDTLDSLNAQIKEMKVSILDEEEDGEMIRALEESSKASKVH